MPDYASYFYLSISQNVENTHCHPTKLNRDSGDDMDFTPPRQDEFQYQIPSVSEIISWRPSGGLSELLPIAVPLPAIVDAGEAHHALGVIFIPSHSRTFEAFGQAATN